MADLTMEELLQAPTKGYGEAIVILEILAENFDIKTNLLQLVQANKFHGRENDNPHTHISNFKRMTATLKYRDVLNDAIKLLHFPYSLEDRARIWDVVSKTDDRIDKLADQISNLVEIVNKQVIAPAKVVKKTCVTCGGAHAYYECIATDIPNNQIPPSVPNEFSSYIKSNEIAIKSMQNQINVLRGDFSKQGENIYRNLKDDMRSILGSFFQNQPSTSGTLLSNTVPNPKGEMKAVTTRSGLAYEGPSIPTESPLEKVDEQNTEEILDKEHSNSSESTAQVQPSVVPISIPEPDVPRTQKKPTILYPSRLNDQKLREKATNQMEKFFQIFHDLHFDISFADALLLMPKFASTINSLLANKDKLLRMEVCHALADLGASINLIPLSIWKKLSLPELTPTRMTVELADMSIIRPKGIAEDVFVKVGKLHFPTDFVVVDFEADPRVPLILGRSFLRTGRALIDVYGEEITLRYNPKSSSPTLVYDNSISESDSSKVPIVKSSSPTLTPFRESDFFLEEIEYFLNDDLIPTGIEKSVYDPKGDILFLEKLVNEDPFQLPSMDLKVAEESKKKSSVEEPPELELKELPSHLDMQSQRRVNPKIHDVIKKEVIKLLDAGMIYPISDSPWVSPIHYVPKKGGMTVIPNENNELIPTRLVTGWRVCIDYRKLNDATRKDHFPLPFMDQMLEMLARNEFYCFLDSFLGYFQIPINPQDQEKTTFTCPYGTFTYRRMPFGLCNALGTFQRCMMSIFHDMIEKTIEVFMDDFSVFEDSFSSCLTNLDKMLNRCEETNLILNWEKCHFMCREGIVLGDTFCLFQKCIDAFNTLKKKLTEAPILVVPDWNLPFELMCDASNYAIGAALGQRKSKHFQPIHYASKMMTEAQIHYTTTEKEMLAVVYAFEKFRPYVVLSKSIVYTNHLALKYLLNK
nr:reverse transcriptase domain-containing protein [Tanacetum cinerariifolium]